MNWEALVLVGLLASSLLPGLIIFVLREDQRRLRVALNIAGAVVKLLLVALLLQGTYEGAIFELRVPLLPHLDLHLQADALSLLFIALSALLWLVTTVYAIGYLEHSHNRSRFFGFFSLCVTATVGVALAGDLFTFIIFYEMLTLATYPLVVHRGTEKARRAGATYLAYTLTGGALLLAGTVWLYSLAGSVEFVVRGFADVARDQPLALQCCFVLIVAGLGVKAALVPLHGWLPQAMVAPAPVSALLHAVAVVKAGAFGIVRVMYDVYGVEFAAELGLTKPLALVAGFTIVYASVRALYQSDLKRRLAFSTVSQLSYIVIGVATVGPVASIGGLVHLVHQGLMKITLFFCAGNVAETLGIHRISDMRGVGRRMPWTMAAFTLASFGMIGAPPMAGFISKWYLGVGALNSGDVWVIGVLVASSLLNAMYFLPIIRSAWFEEPPAQWPDEHKLGTAETSWLLLLPPLFTAALALLVGVFANHPLSPLAWSQLIAEREFYQP